MIRVTQAQLAAQIKKRPPEYLGELKPAMVRTLPDGRFEFDDHHPAWIAAMAKYRPARLAAKKRPQSAWLAARLKACNACRADCFLRHATPCFRARALAEPERACPMGMWAAQQQDGDR